MMSVYLIFMGGHHVCYRTHFVALQVRDLDRSARFYTERLGLQRAPSSPPGAVVFTTAPIPFAVREPLVDLDATPAGLGGGAVAEGRR